ncbi:MAG: hypothetical protein PVG61_04575 [Dehalococcoidia bacterium]|jgi:hypothetical protein
MRKKKAILLVSVIILGVLPAVSLSGCGDTRPGFEEVMANAIEAAAEVETYSMESEAENWDVPWGVRDWENTISSNRNYSGILGRLTDLEDTKELDDVRINGVDYYHYIGKNKVDESVTEQFPSLEYERNDTEFWIGKDDFFLRQCKVYMEIAENNEDTGEIVPYSVATFTFSRFNDPIELEGPELE